VSGIFLLTGKFFIAAYVVCTYYLVFGDIICAENYTNRKMHQLLNRLIGAFNQKKSVKIYTKNNNIT